jgi:hypothetical protein
LARPGIHGWARMADGSRGPRLMVESNPTEAPLSKRVLI